ncbi:ligand-binding sensor domain-containing protein [Dyadobacter fermentans]|uniref:histidine kinase n=1 Tax=Dyadobacter fermentans (strain ATCC 700827 / DSM 18053 / CIP 107007 / KCTC 52180 / NS114) TaxID=471854 RepID=C6VZS5_DYAFD|nr:two-component regulator propeller domain-containing protein [Dyadobacter fermentans]ACT93553.1 histidine kinase [Dyadobacter fermentans DSM 18053]
MKLLLLFIVLFTFSRVSLGRQAESVQLDNFRIEQFTDENGLPQNSVYTIVKDELGFVWLSTEGGLVRFDGQEFTIFRNFGSTHLSVSIGNIGIDPRPKKRGLYAVNNENEFILIEKGVASVDKRFQNRNGQSPFPFVQRGKGHLYERLPTLSHDRPALTPFVIPAGENRFFVYDRKDLSCYVNKKLIGKTHFGNKYPWAFFRLGNNLYYLQKGIFTRYNCVESKLKAQSAKLYGDLRLDKLSGHPDAIELFWNNASEQALVRLDKALYILLKDKNGDLNSKLILEGFDFTTDIIKSAYYDQKTDRIFLGSQLNGLFVFTKKKFQVQTSDFPGTDQVYYGQAAFGDRQVLSAQGIVFRADPSIGKSVASQLPLVTESVTWDKTSIAVDAYGDIWCKNQNRLMVISADGSTMKASWELASEISQLYQAPDSTIWIGTQTSGIYYVKPSWKLGTSPRHFLNAPTEISYIKDSYGFLWVGTAHGLFRINKTTRQMVRINGLDGMYIRSIHLTDDGRQVWITSSQHGFFLLRDKRLTRFPLDRKGYLANSHCILEDRNGYFWITTNHGLFQVLKSDLVEYARHGGMIYYHLYSKSDGFNTNEFNGRCEPCALRLSSGLVSLPSMNGLVWFTPERITPEQPDKAIIIHSLEIDRRPLPVSFDNQQVNFSQQAKEFRIEMLTPFFGNPQNLRFHYALQPKGLQPAETDWLPIDAIFGNRALITISTLSKGDYTLFVRKMDGFVQKNISYKTVQITVPPFWYQTWWFYSLAAALLILAGAWYIRYRINRVKRVNLTLEQQVNARTAQLRGALRDLEKSQQDTINQMQLQSRLMASIAHDVRSPLGAAITVSEEMQKMIARGQYEMATMVGKNIEDSMRQVKASLEEMLSYVKIRIYKKQATTELVDLSALIEENMQLYGKNTRINANTFLNEIPLDTCIETNAPLLKIIVHNLIDNANKFTKNGVVRAYVSVEEKQLRLFIEDSGRGIPSELRDWFQANGKNQSEPAHTGIGLVMVKELAPSVAESIVLEELSPGTRIVITFKRQIFNHQSVLTSDVIAP